MSPMPFCNNLRKGDKVFLPTLGKRGVVVAQPRETSRSVQVLLNGEKTAYRYDILKLRLTDHQGADEEVPPCDGTPPDPQERPERPASATKLPDLDVLSGLRAEKAKNDEEMAHLNLRFKELTTRNDKITKAIEVLS